MYYTINEFANIIGVSKNTLRLWDKKEILIPHHKTKGGHRMYSKDQVDAYLKGLKKENKQITKEAHFLFIDNVIQESNVETLNSKELDSLIKIAEKEKESKVENL